MTLLDSILVVDDEREVRESLSRIFSKEGYKVFLAENARKALELLAERLVNVLVADVKMEGMDGLSLLREAKKIRPSIEAIIMTAYGSTDIAFESGAAGAYAFIQKPFERVVMTTAVRNALERQRLESRVKSLEEELADRYEQKIIGTSTAIRKVKEMVELVAASSATVLIQGESGTGKEVAARAIHRRSIRKDGPFVPVSCAALPETLLEAELFGYEKGAFTGASARKAGRFEVADEGTLFLDEIGETSKATQLKLLRVLQDGEFERLGSTKTTRVDVRIISASNRDLLGAVKNAEFRQDLYYRLNVITIDMPPLRERKEDLPVLANHFLKIYREKNRKELSGFSREAEHALKSYHWPGNVRELENAIERAVVLARKSTILASDLPVEIEGSRSKETEIVLPLGATMEEIERRVIEETLRYSEGDKTKAARILGINPRTISRKIQESQES
ncbi:MAG: sigma-54 dependent transcriptional regulator [Candidatus Eisenbacteria bacterium]|nr:sigma-54 dependent transcriptional regulator [Candidatus Eisenbacteria bacterium]